MNPPVLAEVRRGAATESVHRGAVVAVRADGELLAMDGDPHLRFFARSALKPIQALPLVADGGATRFELTRSELAVICGSHSAEPMHLVAVRSILQKAGLDESALLCGGQWPLHQPSAEAMRARGEAPRPIHDNCSGKHAGLLALARLHGWETTTYRSFDHPLQQRVREALVVLTGNTHAADTPATDGCGVPTYHLALEDLAAAFARLAAPAALASPWGEAAGAVIAAMMGFPEMVAGTDRLDTVLMSLANGRLISKGGGEAVIAVGVVRAPGVGVAAKIEDGGGRAVGPVIIEALRQLDVLSGDEVRVLAPLHRPPVLDRRGHQVGEIVPVLELR